LFIAGSNIRDAISHRVMSLFDHPYIAFFPGSPVSGWKLAMQLTQPSRVNIDASMALVLRTSKQYFDRLATGNSPRAQ